MSNLPFMAALGFFLLGCIVMLIIYPRFIHWAKVYLNEFHGGECAICGRKTYVTACRRCSKEVAFCHYYSVLGTDLPNQEKIRARRSSAICTGCLTIDERESLESLLK